MSGAPKKSLGQHFLTNVNIARSIVQSVGQQINGHKVLEIGPGRGFLTREILRSKAISLLAVEIDNELAPLLQEQIKDPRLNVFCQDFLEFDLAKLGLEPSQCVTQTDCGQEKCGGAIILANLPYNVACPILLKIYQNISYFCSGTVMVQEEMAQKLVATSGKEVSSLTIFLNHRLEFQLLEKIGPENFNPPPKVFSRLLHFKPRQNPLFIENEQEFWKFVRQAFHWPNKTIKNNLKATQYSASALTKDDKRFDCRARQLKLIDLVELFKIL